MSFPLCLDQLRTAEYKKLYKHVFSPLLLLGISEFLIFYGSLVLLQGKKTVHYQNLALESDEGGSGFAIHRKQKTPIVWKVEKVELWL